MQLKVERKYVTVVWNVNAECRRVVGPMAKEFGMSVEEFLTRQSKCTLPAQTQKRERGYRFKKGTKTTFVCEDPEIMRRIERAAFAEEESVLAFVMGAIMSHVECLEEDMIVSPKTGQPVCDELHDLEKFRSRVCHRDLAAA